VTLEAWPSEAALCVKRDPQAQPVELARAAVRPPAFEAEATALPETVVHPVDLGTILVPADWLLLAGGQKATVEVAALSRTSEVPGARVAAWYESAPEQRVAAGMPLSQGRKARATLGLGHSSRPPKEDVLHVAIADGAGKELWHKTIRVMRVPEAPRWPRFGAVATNLRYDAPIPVNGRPASVDYDEGWDPALQDVVVFFPNGARFVFWRGSSYIPFWAGRFNTGLCYEWAERHSPNVGFTDCPEPLMDKELRYGRVAIVESTPARVHIQWSYQSCDRNYKVNGDLAVEDYVFYPDGFGTRTLTLTCIPEARYELNEFIILTPQAAFPFDVLPPDLVDILTPVGAKAELRFPCFPEEQKGELEKIAGTQAPIYRIRLSKCDSLAAIQFCPWGAGPMPPGFAPFYDRGCLVTPAYWGSHWPLSRGWGTGWSINDRIRVSPAHNSLMTAGDKRPKPIRDETLATRDALGELKTMRRQTWVWLIGMTDAGDEALRQWAQSFSKPPALRLRGARLDAQPYVPERRALRVVVEDDTVAITITPTGHCVNPVLELGEAPKALRGVRLDDQPLGSDHYRWDGATLWLKASLGRPATLHLAFGGGS
jgi:hypothetical protein